MIKTRTLKSYSSFFNIGIRVIDLLTVLCCGLLTYYISDAHERYAVFDVHGLPAHYLNVVSLAIVLTAFLFPLFNIYRVWRGTSTLLELKALTMAWFLVGLVLAGLAFVTQTGADFSRQWMGLWFASVWLALVGFRVLLRVSLRWLRSGGFNHLNIVIVGTGEQACVVADRLRRSTWFGLDISALFGTSAAGLPRWLRDKKIITDVAELRKYVDEGGVDQVWISLPHSEEKTIHSVISALESSVAEIRYVPDVFEYQLMHRSLSNVAGVPVVNVSYSAIDGMNKIIKTCEDYLLSVVLLILSSPLLLLIAIGVKLSSPGPVLYRQQRVGWNGDVFTMFKFRSMPVEAEKNTGPVWSSSIDDRATKFGAFLRRTSLDELPQLLNVLKGEMSLIGPRPERPMFVEEYKSAVPHYMKKHLVNAGVTGWAQVHGWRGDTSLHTRIEHDLYYIENWSVWLDLKIIVMTVLRGLVHKNAY